MSCNYFNFSHEQIIHNKTNNYDIINKVHKRLLAESHEEDIFNFLSEENSFSQPIDNKSDQNVTEYHKISSTCILNHEIQQGNYSQSEKIEWGNGNNNKSLLHKSHKKSSYKNIKIIFIITLFLIFL
ncbi:Plasmodium exported protein (hyp10), unknown, putative [Plasmodium sp.]|nr:Plasmodium exported protein (hyp10), unknown, putative [Plasmodium sp.]